VWKGFPGSVNVLVSVGKIYKLKIEKPVSEY
jgi:hypothetical protein